MPRHSREKSGSAGLYHVTLTVSDRQPVLGRLTTPDDNLVRAIVHYMNGTEV